MGNPVQEVYISVDVETSGPNPGDYSLLSIGACLVSDLERAFYIELQPLNDRAEPQAMSVCDLSLTQLAEYGAVPEEAMARFESWILRQVDPEQKPVFVGFNASFDWMFVNYYFYRFLGRNPFGHAALDIKAYYMGLKGVLWAQTSMRYLAERYMDGQPLVHHALNDARKQATMFSKMLAETGVLIQK